MSWNKRRLSEGEMSGMVRRLGPQNSKSFHKSRSIPEAISLDMCGSASSAIKHGILEKMSFCLFRKKAVRESKRKEVINKANIFMEQQ